MMKAPPDISWKKNLYDNHNFPDNYTNESFLENLRKNIKPHNITLTEALTLGASISIRLSIVTLFEIIFFSLYNEWLTPDFVFVTSTLLMVIGYITYNINILNLLHKLKKDFRTALLFLVFGYILSPTLKTLTETISTDTIYAMTLLMFLIHLIFCKYDKSLISLTDSLSMTSSIFGSLMLASRLTTPLHAFSLLTVSVQCFILLPFLMFQIKNMILISSILAIITIYILVFMSITLTYLFIATTVFIHFVCPFLYVRSQKYKDNIYGPWDEAVIPS